MNRKKLFAFLIINILIVIFEAIGLAISLSELGLEGLKYYTELSNIFLFISSVINIFFTANSIFNRKTKIPKIVWSLFHSAVSATTLTFLVVVFVLSWMYGSLLLVLTKGAMVYTHTICPLLGIICFVLFAPKSFTKRSALYATSFTGLYAIVAVVANFMRFWHGPYPFLFVYEQPIWASIAWCIGLLAGAWGISRLLIMGKIKSR